MATLGELEANNTPPKNGFASLGYILGGGGKAQAQNVYDTTLKSGATALEALDKASITRAQLIASKNLNAAIAADPSFAGHVALAQSLMGMADGQPNLNTYADGMKAFQDADFRKSAVDAAVLGDPVKANAYMTGVASGPVAHTAVGPSGAFDPLGTPSQVIHPTALTAADIGLKGAQAGNANAAAGEHEARLPLIGAQTENAKAETALHTTQNTVLGQKKSPGVSAADIAMAGSVYEQEAKAADGDPNKLAAAEQKYHDAINPQPDSGPLGAVGGLVQALSSVLGGGATAAHAPLGSAHAKTIVRTGTMNGKKVVQYSDGTVDYAP